MPSELIAIKMANFVFPRLSRNYRYYVFFRSNDEGDKISPKILWPAFLTIFLVCNTPKDKISGLIFKILTHLSSTIWHIENDMSATQEIVFHLVLPLKGFLFLVSFLIIVYPTVHSLWKSRFFWRNLDLKRISILAFSIFIVLSLLVFPYSYPDGLNPHPWGTSGMGNRYGHASLNPFEQSTGWYYRRILKPAIAHLIQMDGVFLYYLFSLICTFFLIFLTIIFIESKILRFQNSRKGTKSLYKQNISLLCYISVATSSYIMTDFLWPGYVDQLTFILILLMACIPMNRQARLGIVALCMVNHEMSAFALIPIIFFCFPKREIGQALGAIILYLVLWFSTYTGISGALAIHSEQSVLQSFLENYRLGLVGIFFSYKLFWLIFLYTMWLLWRQKDKGTLFAIGSMVLFPVTTAALALDTTRGSGYGFFGILIALSIVINDYNRLPKQGFHLAFSSILYANVICPSYPIILGYPASLSSYPYRGLYQLIHSVFRSLLF